MPFDIILSLAGLAISAIAAAAIAIDARKPGRRPAFLALVFVEATAFFLGLIFGRLPGGSFASAALSYCGTLFGLPSLYLFERSTVEPGGRRSWRHYLPALANIPLGLAMALLASRGNGGVPHAIYYLALITAQTAQLVFYGRAALTLARAYRKGSGADWLLRAARAVIAAYAVITALSWTILLSAIAEESLGREIDPFPWIDPLAVLTSLFLAWTLGLCVLWGRDRASPESREARKYGGRPLPEAEAASLVRKVRALLESERDLSSEAVQPRALATRLGVPYYLLSRAVNEGEGMNLLDLVNGYRIERAKAILASRPDANVLDACFEAGFQAKSTFNEVFKKAEGMTPRQYRERVSRSPAASSRGP